MRKNKELYSDTLLCQYVWLKKFTKEIRFTHLHIPVESQDIPLKHKQIIPITG